MVPCPGAQDRITRVEVPGPADAVVHVGYEGRGAQVQHETPVVVSAVWIPEHDGRILSRSNLGEREQNLERDPIVEVDRRVGICRLVVEARGERIGKVPRGRIDNVLDRVRGTRRIRNLQGGRRRIRGRTGPL